MICQNTSCTHCLCSGHQGVHFLGSVCGKLVHGYDYWDAELLHILHMSLQIPHATRHSGDILVLEICICFSMELQRSHSCNDNGCIWRQSCLATFDIKKLLSAKVCPK